VCAVLSIMAAEGKRRPSLANISAAVSFVPETVSTLRYAWADHRFWAGSRFWASYSMGGVTASPVDLAVSEAFQVSTIHAGTGVLCPPRVGSPVMITVPLTVSRSVFLDL